MILKHHISQKGPTLLHIPLVPAWYNFVMNNNWHIILFADENDNPTYKVIISPTDLRTNRLYIRIYILWLNLIIQVTCWLNCTFNTVVGTQFGSGGYWKPSLLEAFDFWAFKGWNTKRYLNQWKKKNYKRILWKWNQCQIRNDKNRKLNSWPKFIF